MQRGSSIRLAIRTQHYPFGVLLRRIVSCACCSAPYILRASLLLLMLPLLLHRTCKELVHTSEYSNIVKDLTNYLRTKWILNGLGPDQFDAARAKSLFTAMNLRHR